MTVIPFAGELPEVDRPTDLKEAGLGQRDALLQVADDVDLWRSPDAETYAKCAINGHSEHHAIASRSFRDFLIGGVARRFTVNGRPASVGENALRDARLAIEARAYLGGAEHDAELRVVEHQKSVFIDLGNEVWSAIQVRPDGWTTVLEPPVPIVRSRRTAAMPAPAVRGDLAPLRRLLGRLTDADFVLFVAWCLGALWPAGPYPILIVGGEAGSGKSTLARLAQRIVDPVVGNLLQPPGDDRDLIAAARHGRVLAFDNISVIKPDLADSICRLATGAEIGGRALFTNHDSASFSACRPIILNGIPDLAARGDLADRSLVIRLGNLDARVSERDWWRQVDKVLPQTFAALLTALSAGLRDLERTATPNLRMADFARLIAAAEGELPWTRGAFIAAYEANRAEAVQAIVEGDLVASKILAFAKDRNDWSGLKSALYTELSIDVSVEARRSGDWPGNVRWFSDRLTRAAPALRAMGIDVANGGHTNAGSRVSIRRIASLASPASPKPGNGHSNGDASDATDAISQVSGSNRLSADDRAFVEELGGGRQ